MYRHNFISDKIHLEIYNVLNWDSDYQVCQQVYQRLKIEEGKVNKKK